MMKHSNPIELYLNDSAYINFSDPTIHVKINEFHAKDLNPIELIREVYEFVRDEIDHSYDIKEKQVTISASQVLQYKHGICYAKSHLLAALLRGLGIPSGLCYQRLTLYDKPEDGHCIHALNTVYLQEEERWIRLDARGNKRGIDAQFSTDIEKLAFPIRAHYGELEYEINYPEPHPEIIKALESSKNYTTVYEKNLPTALC